MTSLKTLSPESALLAKLLLPQYRAQFLRLELFTRNLVLLAPKKLPSRLAMVNMGNIRLHRAAMGNILVTVLLPADLRRRLTMTGWHGSTLERNRRAHLRKASRHRNRVVDRPRPQLLKGLMHTLAQPRLNQLAL